MTALYIILGIFAVISLIVFSSIKIYITYDEQIKLLIGFWFLKFRIIPSYKRKDKKSKKKSDIKPKKKSDKRESLQIDEIFNIVRCVLEHLKPVLKSVRIKPLKLNVTVADDDAASTAIKVGTINAVVWPFVGWLANTVKVKKQSVNINPDYDGKSKVDFDTCIFIRLNHIIAAGLGILVGIYKLKFDKDGA